MYAITVQANSTILYVYKARSLKAAKEVAAREVDAAVFLNKDRYHGHVDDNGNGWVFDTDNGNSVKKRIRIHKFMD